MRINRQSRWLAATLLAFGSLEGLAMPPGHGMHGMSGMQGGVEAPPLPSDRGLTPAVDLAALDSLAGVIERIDRERVVYLGESHDNFAHHMLQLEVVRRLHARNPDLAIGLEMFQRSAQPVLDRFVAGEITEQQMLMETDWFQVWRFDYALYRPILRFAAENHLPLIALNVADTLKGRVAKVGLAGLDEVEKQQLPREMGKADPAYEARLQASFFQHPGQEGRSFDRFVEVQLLWDETMAESVADHLAAHPQRRMVVLAGSGHLMYRSGIPDRVERRTGLRGKVLLPNSGLTPEPALADYLLFPGNERMPPLGKVGVYLKDPDGGEGVEIGEVAEESGGATAGLQAGDRILALNGEPVKKPGEVRGRLIDAKPGDKAMLTLQRKLLFTTRVWEVEVTLGE